MTGRQHFVVSVLVTVLQVANTALWDQNITTDRDAALLVMGTVYGWFVTPDLDIDAGTFLQRKHNILSRIWRLLWWPYAKLIKHRSALSHLPVLGTALRMMYMFPVVVILLHFVGIQGFVWFFCGVAIQDFSHAFVDYVK